MLLLEFNIGAKHVFHVLSVVCACIKRRKKALNRKKEVFIELGQVDAASGRAPS